ncbi:HAD family hydrolase [Ruminococcus sp. 5_1_39BFAA]|uniref:HAD family hydrolase n=1 Tax=Ruminococcus sp. 5_1_39BFAA TaxID=457412 RepID=UPI00356A7640
MRGAIFDVDGTLLDSMPIWMDAGARYLKALGLVPEEGLGDKLFSMTMTEGADYLNHAYGLQKEPSRIITEINAIVEEFYFGEAPLKPGAMELLGQMRAAGMKLSVATSTDHHLIEGAFRRLGILEYFSGIFTCSQVGAGKDKPLIYEMAAQAMGTAPAETCVLEDALHALVTAKKAGFFTIGIYDEASAAKQEELQKEADLYGKSLSDILEKLKEEQKL